MATPPEEPRKVGRPTKYNEAYNEQVVDFLAEGYSVEAFAGEIGVASSTLDSWQKEYPEFQGAVKRGRAKAILFWEGVLQDCAKKNEGNVTAIIFGLKNRGAASWNDKLALEVDLNAKVATVEVTPENAKELYSEMLGKPAT